jgi:cell wall-associated NlpC family hydrolase
LLFNYYYINKSAIITWRFSKYGLSLSHTYMPPMKKPIFLFTIACFLISLLDSCHSSEKATVSRSRQPKFINNVYIDPHAKAGTTANAIDHTKHPDKTKPVVKTHTQPVQQTHQTQTNTASTALIEPKPNKQEPLSVIRKKYASMLELPPSDISNFSLYKFIDRWIGTKYCIGGNDIKGIDCSGFAQKLYGEVYGVDLLRTAIEQFSNCKRIKNPKDASEGDLVFFHIRSKRISHVGVYLANNYFVHASRSGGVMISNLDEDYWHKYYAGCGKIPRMDKTEVAARGTQ